jgi:hypothetical protein
MPQLRELTSDSLMRGNLKFWSHPTTPHACDPFKRAKGLIHKDERSLRRSLTLRERGESINPLQLIQQPLKSLRESPRLGSPLTFPFEWSGSAHLKHEVSYL